MNKRGISPLIATVLLVSFVVILATIIMFWGRGFVTDLMHKRGEVSLVKFDCSKVEIEILGVSNGLLEIRNNSPIKIAGLRLRFGGGDVLDKSNLRIEPYEETSVTLLEGETKVDVIPLLRPQGLGAPAIPCSDKHRLVNI